MNITVPESLGLGSWVEGQEEKEQDYKSNTKRINRVAEIKEMCLLYFCNCRTRGDNSPVISEVKTEVQSDR